MILPRRFIPFLLLLTLLPARVEAADFVVVANKDNPVESMKRSDVKKIFLGKKTFWRKTGRSIEVLLQSGGDAHRSFVFEILNKSPLQLSMYWKQALFSGTGIPPKKYHDCQSIKEAVAANPWAIGYIDARQLDETIKKIKLN